MEKNYICERGGNFSVGERRSRKFFWVEEVPGCVVYGWTSEECVLVRLKDRVWFYSNLWVYMDKSIILLTFV